MVNPFDLGSEGRFDAWYWLISVLVLFYGMLSWQGTSGYHASAINAHEAKRANILAGWRFRVLMLVTLLIPLCILAVQHDPAFAETASAIQQVVDAQPTAATAAEVRAPAAARFMLPPILLGLFSMARGFSGTTISRVHGQPKQVDGRYVIPMYHPAAALHRGSLRGEILADFARLPELLERARTNFASPQSRLG